MNLDKLLLLIKCIDGVGDSSIRKMILFNRFKDCCPKTLGDVLAFIKANTDCFARKSIINDLTIEDIKLAKIRLQLIETRSKGMGINYISYYNPDYPSCFRAVKNTKACDFPVILYYKGDISLLGSENAVSIIGTRTPSKKAVEACLELSKSFAEKGCVVVSGLADGCDTAAHIGCLEGNGRTVAIVGTGLDVVFPKSNEPLLESILNRGGLVLSEYPIGFKGSSYSFVERDRLQAAAAGEIVVVQTSKSGGTMHAAKAAMKYDKKLLVVDPTLMNDGDFSGNEELIRNYGAVSINPYA